MPSDAKARRLPATWKLPMKWGNWAMQERPELTRDNVRSIAAEFRDHWIAQPGQRGVKLDWFATWRNWVRRDQWMGKKPLRSRESNWWMSNAGTDAKGRELGIVARGGESYENYKARIFEQINATK